MDHSANRVDERFTLSESPSQPAPIRSIKAFEQESAREAADFQWAQDAAVRIREWLPTAEVSNVTPWTVRIDVPEKVVHLNDVDYSRRARTLVALLAYAGWSAAELKYGRVTLYATRQAIEIVTDDGERFSPMYSPPDLGHDVTTSLNNGASRGCADGTTEWTPGHRIRLVRYLNTFDATPLNLLRVATAAVFELTLHRTYFDQGFFNVTVGYDQYVRTQEGPVRLRLGRDGIDIEGKINRQANINGTSRISGGPPLRNWFQQNFNVMDTVAVDLSSQDVIILDKVGSS